MDYSEKDIENYIWECEKLAFPDIHIFARQFKTDLGIIDLLGYNHKQNRLVVIELKKGIVDESAVGQLMRYMAVMAENIGVYKEWDYCPDYIKNLQCPAVYGVLVGSGCTDGVMVITRLFKMIEFYQFEATININFWEGRTIRHDYSLYQDIKRFRGVEGSVEKIISNIEPEVINESEESQAGVL